MTPKKKKLVSPIVDFAEKIEEEDEEEKKPSMMEQAMALLINATAKNTEILGKVADSLDSMNEKLDKPVVDKQHQIDLDQENKRNPFKIQMRYFVEQRTQDL